MTAEDGTYPDPAWDDARIALGEVAEVFRANATVTPEDLQGVRNYALIPEGVRTTLENLTPDEQAFVKDFIAVLASNHFYIEGGEGGLRFY
jgi:hypothetical protein